jgi:hypothetical protein
MNATGIEPITVVVNGKAVAKGRPRITKRGFAYTPAARASMRRTPDWLQDSRCRIGRHCKDQSGSNS